MTGERPSPERKRPAKRPSSRLPQSSARLKALIPYLIGGLLVALFACLAMGASFVAARQIAMEWSGSSGLLRPLLRGGTSSPALNAQGTPLPPLPTGESHLPAVTLTPWDGAGRVTLLLLGLDYRDWEQQSEAARSDTMILLTLDPQSKTAGILSIPRDLWVAIPGFKHGKINTAYYLGDAYKLPGGGPALAVKTVEQFLGVPINYYAQVDFAAFVRFIDEIGGVKIDVPAPITIDLIGKGASTKKRLQPGVQVLPGEWALAYARTRYTEGGDFDRAARQQQVIMAIREKVLDARMLPTLIAKAPQLYAELSGGIRTNLSLEDAIRLALLAEQVPRENIRRAIINKDNVLFGQSPDGLSILIPIPDDIHQIRDQVFASAGALGPLTPGTPLERARAEEARLAIYNGSGDPSLARRAEAYFKSQGLNVVLVAEAGRAYAATAVVDHSGSPYLLAYLVEALRIAGARITLDYQPNAQADVELYLGADLLRSNLIP